MIDFFNSQSLVIKIAIIGVSITALTFALNFILKPFFKWFKQKNAKLLVKAVVHIEMVAAIGLSRTTPTNRRCVVTMTVINKTGNTRFIEKILFKTPRKINDNKIHQWIHINMKDRFPIKIEAGQKITETIDAKDLYDALLLELNVGENVRFGIADSYEEKHFSEKIKVRDITFPLKSL
jgi:hypothetical protein